MWGQVSLEVWHVSNRDLVSLSVMYQSFLPLPPSPLLSSLKLNVSNASCAPNTLLSTASLLNNSSGFQYPKILKG